MCQMKATWSGFIFLPFHGEGASLRVLVQGADEIDVHALLLAQDAERAELPPLVGSEIRTHLSVWASAAEPLDEVQVV
jgi:hypothetical protein